MGDRSILNLKGRRLIGLDVDASGVRTIQLRRRNNQYVVTGAAVSGVAPWDNDPERHRTNTAEAVRHCLEALEPGGKLAICGLRGPEVVVRGFEFPCLPPEEIDGAVALEAAQTCPFSTDDSALDHQVTSDDDRKTRGYWVAATHSLINDRRRLAHEAGLKCALMDVDGLALLNGLEGLTSQEGTDADSDKDNHHEQARPAVLSIGDFYTSIAIVDHAHRPFVRDVASGEQDIVHQMVRETKRPPETVRTVLYEEQDAEEETHRQGLEKACTPLLNSIATTLRYYAAENRFTRISEVLVCGRLAMAPSFLSLLSTKLSIEAKSWNPVAQLPCEADEQCQTLLQEAGPTLAVATGLAMRTI